MSRTHSLLPVLAAGLIYSSPAMAAPQLTGTVAIGPEPVTVVVEAGTHQAFAADAGLGAIIQYDGARGSVLAPINVEGQPSSLTLDNRGHRLFVGNQDTVGAAVSVIDTGSGQAQTFLPSGHRVWCLGFDEALNRLYVGDPDAGELVAVDGASGQTQGSVPLGGAPVSIAVNPGNGEVAVAVQGNAPALVVVDPNNLDANPLAIPISDGQPMQVAVDGTTGKFFVSRSGVDPALLVLRPASPAFDNSIPVAGGVTGIAIDQNSQIYLAHATGQASIIDGTTGNPVTDVPIGAGPNQVSIAPNHVAVDPDSSPTRVYIVDTASGTLDILTNQ
jgi:DNA-binding beta-propeller fold protein YncE